jgi:hypothetical protein
MSGFTGVEEVLDRLDAWEIRVQERAYATAEAIGNLLVEYARTHHFWQSRTGATDASTQAEVLLKGDLLEVVLTVGTDYARFLELARNGRWAWLWEAVSQNEGAIRSLLSDSLQEVAV